MNDLQIKELDQKSKEISNQSEILDSNYKKFLGGRNIGDDLRATYLKIQSLNRTELQEGLLIQYDNILDKFERMAFEQANLEYENSKEFLKLIEELDNLTNKEGNKIKDYIIDGGIIEGMIAIKEGIDKACEQIIQELEQTLKTILSPDEWNNIYEGLKDAITNPIEFMENIIKFVKEEFADLAKDFHLYDVNSTKAGFAVQMGEFVPKTFLPILISSVGTGKFTKFLSFAKIDKYVPESVLSKLSHKKFDKKDGPDSNKKVSTKNNTDLMELEDSFWDFKTGGKIDSYTIRNKFVFVKRIEKIVGEKDMFIETMKNPKKIINFHKSINSMVKYLDEALPLMKTTGIDNVKQHIASLNRMKFQLMDYYKNNPTNKGLLILAKSVTNENFEKVYLGLNKIHNNLSN
ncbi:MAG: hypothetical protein V3575_01560 [Candidatus Absconditabacteria bacterium]